MQVLGYPRTWPTTCFITPGCNADVFGHTNGFGDFVLFDDLGPPWPIHDCYLNRFVISAAPFPGLRSVLTSRTSDYLVPHVPVPSLARVDVKNIKRVAPEDLLGKGEINL